MGSRVTSFGVETLVPGEGRLRITATGAEVLHSGLGLARITSFAAEVLEAEPEPPGHCGLYVTAGGSVSLRVDFIPGGFEARADYAAGAVAPEASSTAWQLLGRTPTAAILSTPPFLPGTTVWVRMRSEKPGTLPFDWTVPESVTT